MYTCVVSTGKTNHIVTTHSDCCLLWHHYQGWKEEGEGGRRELGSERERGGGGGEGERGEGGEGEREREGGERQVGGRRGVTEGMVEGRARHKERDSLGLLGTCIIDACVGTC